MHSCTFGQLFVWLATAGLHWLLLALRQVVCAPGMHFNTALCQLRTDMECEMQG
mgnify:CR=1 FL=1